ncbi:hypothetical protein [Paenibacillus agilis]|uniref:hypothetical protein n=1 Tax=Paenibacillus agilis TaxID=3020863 RepID=UPI001649D057|nr:hypothetical protein [Paenibacillus agilis]
MAVKFITPSSKVEIQAKSFDKLPDLKDHNDGSEALILDTGEVFRWGEGEWHRI